jgi:two-component system cell cycle response regulator
MRTLQRQAVIITLFCLAFWVVLLVKPGGSGDITLIDNLFAIAGIVITAFLCLGSIRRSLHRGLGDAASSRSHHIPAALILIGMASLGELVATSLWTYYQNFLDQPPFPSWADAAYLCEYPTLLAGILLLPMQRLVAAARLRIAIDSLLIMLAIVTFSWYFVLGPTVLQGGEQSLAKVVSAAYPLADLVLFAAVLILWARSGHAAMRPIVAPLAAGLLLFVVADSVFDYQSLQGTYATGSLIDPLWSLGFLLIGLSTQMLSRYEQQESDARALHAAALPPFWRTLVPYAVLPPMGGLLVYTIHRHGVNSLAVGVYVCGAMLLVLIVGRQILALLENRHLYRQVAEANLRLQALATTDPLTELPNHRSIVVALDQEIERCRRYSRGCAVLILDLDHFKVLNDTYGHLAGDAALKDAASLMRQTLRTVDTVGRWGGEEFVILLPELHTAEARLIAERLRGAVGSHAGSTRGRVPITCSIGLALYPDDGTDRDSLFAAADRAMYAAKTLGRNQVRTFAEPAVAALQSKVAGSHEEDTLLGTVNALAALIDARDRYTGTHAQTVATLAHQVAEVMHLSTGEARTVELAARLHDIGKIAVPDEVLRKPGPLTEEEWIVMRAHAAIGADVVRQVPALHMVAPIIRGHHERWDGQGYPDQLAGEAIPVGARIICAVDAYAAMTTNRPYRQALDPTCALVELHRCAASQFDPAVVTTLETVLAEGRSGRRQSGVA